MSENQIIAYIRSVPRLSAKFSKLTMDGRRRVIFIADGDVWRIDEMIEDILEEETALV